MNKRASLHSQAFTLIELLVVIAIIAVLAGLLFPVFGKSRKVAAEARTVSNLRQIGAAIGAYGSEHNDELPGPLTLEQYPVFGKNPEIDKGSLVKRLALYLSVSKQGDTDKASGEFDMFTCPGLTGVGHDDVPGFIMNLEKVPDYDQPAWGDVKTDIPPLKNAALTSWRDTASDALTANGNVVLARKWAMRHTDQKDAKEMKITADWVQKLPEERAFDDHYQALFFDWHVERYVPTTSIQTGGATTGGGGVSGGVRPRAR